MGSGEMPNDYYFKKEPEEIRKMVRELYERSMVIDPIVETMIPIVEVPNILEVPENEQTNQIEEERNEKKRKRKKAKVTKEKSQT